MEASNNSIISYNQDTWWYYNKGEDMERGGKYVWVPYDPETNNIMERNRKLEINLFVVQILGTDYYINFERMQQYQKQDPLKCREIQRNENPNVSLNPNLNQNLNRDLNKNGNLNSIINSNPNSNPISDSNSLINLDTSINSNNRNSFSLLNNMNPLDKPGTSSFFGRLDSQDNYPNSIASNPSINILNNDSTYSRSRFQDLNDSVSFNCQLRDSQADARNAQITIKLCELFGDPQTDKGFIFEKNNQLFNTEIHLSRRIYEQLHKKFYKQINFKDLNEITSYLKN